MSSNKNVSIDLLCQAIRSIKKQKQRPNVERIGHFLSKHFRSNFSVERTLEILEEYVAKGRLNKRTKNDSDTYEIPTETSNHSSLPDSNKSETTSKDRGKITSQSSATKSEDIIDRLFCVSVEQVVSAVRDLGSAKRHEIENVIRKTTIAKARSSDLNPDILSQYSCLIKSLLDEALTKGDIISDSGRRYIVKPKTEAETSNSQEEAPVIKSKLSAPKSRNPKETPPDVPKRRRSTSSACSPGRQRGGQQSNSSFSVCDEPANNTSTNKRRQSPSSPDISIPKKKKKMAKPIPVCSFCLGDEHMNKRTNEPEDMVACGDCGRCGHPTCLKWPEALYAKVRTLRWQCLQCKQCSFCGKSSHVDEDLLLCDACDRGFHMACCDPPITRAPKGRWVCNLCDPSKGRPVRKPLFDDELFTAEELANMSMKESKLVQVQKQTASLQDGLSRFFTPTNRRQSRVSQQVGEASGVLLLTPPPIMSATVVSAQYMRPEEYKRHQKLKEKEEKRVAKQARVKEKREQVEARRAQLLQEKLDKKKKRESIKKASAGMKAARKLLKKLHKKRQDNSSGRPGPKKGGASVASSSESVTCPVPGKRPRGRPRKNPIVSDGDDPSSQKRSVVANKPVAEVEFDSYEDETQRITDKDRELFQEIQKELHSSLPPAASLSPRCPRSPNGTVLPPQFNVDRSQSSNNSTSACLESPNKMFKNSSEDVRFPSKIQLGKYVIHTWYSSPYPSEYAKLNVLYICEYCLKYIKSLTVYIRHMEKCTTHFPPGNEIYRQGNLSVWEVDGYSAKLYCQSLCLLAKLFLDHKTLYYDVEPFLFYVLTVCDDSSCHLIGYFSKEKHSSHKYNLSCIMVLPQYQKHNYGRFLIEFSYLLSRIEGEPGSPEKPLSELGRLSYESYWLSKVVPYVERILHNDDRSCPHSHPNLIIADISKETGIDAHDIAATLQQLCTIKVSKEGKLVLVFDREKLGSLIDKYQKRSSSWVILKSESLRWSPLVQQNQSKLSSHPHSPISPDSTNNRQNNSSGSGSPGLSSRSRTRSQQLNRKNIAVRESPNKVTQNCRPKKSWNRRHADSSSEDDSSARPSNSRSSGSARPTRGRASSRVASSSAPASTVRSGAAGDNSRNASDLHSVVLQRSYSSFFNEAFIYKNILPTENSPANSLDVSNKFTPTELTCLTVDVEDDATVAMDEESVSSKSTMCTNNNHFRKKSTTTATDDSSSSDDDYQSDASRKTPTADELFVKKLSLELEAEEDLNVGEDIAEDALDVFSGLSPISCDNQVTIPELSFIRDDEASNNLNETDEVSLGAPDISKMTEFEHSPRSALLSDDESPDLESHDLEDHQPPLPPTVVTQSPKLDSGYEESIDNTSRTVANDDSAKLINDALHNDKELEEVDSQDLSLLDFHEAISSEEPIPSLQDKFTNCSEEVTDSSCIQMLCLDHLEERKCETPPPELDERPSSSDMLEDEVNISRQMPDIVNEMEPFDHKTKVVLNNKDLDNNADFKLNTTFMTVTIPQNSPIESSGSTQNRTPSINADFSPPYRMPIIVNNQGGSSENDFNNSPPESNTSECLLDNGAGGSIDALVNSSPVLESGENSLFDSSFNTNDSLLKAISSPAIQEAVDETAPPSINPSSSSFDNNTSLEARDGDSHDDITQSVFISNNETSSLNFIEDEFPDKLCVSSSEPVNISQSGTLYSNTNNGLHIQTSIAFSSSSCSPQKSSAISTNQEANSYSKLSEHEPSYVLNHNPQFSNSNLQIQNTFESMKTINSPTSVISQTVNILHSPDEMLSYDSSNKLGYLNDNVNSNLFSDYKRLNFISDLCSSRTCDPVYDNTSSSVNVVSSTPNNLQRTISVSLHQSPTTGIGPSMHFSQPSTPTAAFPNKHPHQPSPPHPVPPKRNQAPTPTSPKQVSMPSPYKAQLGNSSLYYHNMQSSTHPGVIARQLSAPTNLSGTTKLQSFPSEHSPALLKKSKANQSNKKGQFNPPPVINSISSSLPYTQKPNPSMPIHPSKNLLQNYYHTQSYFDPAANKHITTANLAHPQQLSPYLYAPSMQPYPQSLYDYNSLPHEQHFTPYQQQSAYNVANKAAGYNIMPPNTFPQSVANANNLAVKAAAAAWPPAAHGVYPYGNAGVSMASFAVAAAQRSHYPTAAYAYPHHGQHSHMMPQ